MKTLIIKTKNLISNLNKSLIKIYIKNCQKLDLEAFPYAVYCSNENLNDKNRKYNLRDGTPRKKLPVGNLFLFIGG